MTAECVLTAPPMICSQDVDPQLGIAHGLVARLPRLRSPLPLLSLRLRDPRDEPRRHRVRLWSVAGIENRRWLQRRHQGIPPRRLHQEEWRSLVRRFIGTSDARISSDQ